MALDKFIGERRKLFKLGYFVFISFQLGSEIAVNCLKSRKINHSGTQKHISCAGIAPVRNYDGPGYGFDVDDKQPESSSTQTPSGFVDVPDGACPSEPHDQYIAHKFRLSPGSSKSSPCTLQSSLIPEWGWLLHSSEPAGISHAGRITRCTMDVTNPYQYLI
jgi:hypothetical protein